MILKPSRNVSDVIKTFQDQDQDQDLNFKTKTNTLKFFQDQDQAFCSFLRCILEADRKPFIIFGRKRKCRRK